MIKQLRVSLSVCVALAALLFYAALPQLDRMGKTEYFTAPSSSASMLDEGTVLRPCAGVFSVRAESVFSVGECPLEEVLERYSARVVMEERTGEVISYYCFSPALRGGVILCGKRVNLHVAAAPYGYTVGTPIICGGF